MRVIRVVVTVVLALGIGGVFGLAAGEDVRTLDDHTDLVRSVAFNPEGTLLASGSKDSTIKVWDVESGEVLATLAGHVGMVRSVLFSPDGTLLASAGADGAVRFWDVGSWAELLVLAHPDEVNSVAFSPDGALLVTACDDTRVRLWDVAAAEEVLSLSGHAGFVWSVAFSPDGQRVASGSEDGTARLWDVLTGQSLRTLVHQIDGQRVPVNTVAFSPDGAMLATGSDANVIELWTVSTGEKVRDEPLQGHQARIWSVAFSVDGAWLASGSEDAAAILWTASTGRKVHTLVGHGATVFSVAFSPDGRLLATGSADGTIRLWPVEPPPPAPAVLAWIPCTDEAEEYANVTTALGFEPDVTRTRNPDELALLLDGVVTLLIPEQETCSESGLADMGADCAEALLRFLDAGGTIVGMTYWRGAEDILRGAGILPGVDDALDATGDTLTVVAPDHPLARGVAASFTGRDGSTGFSGVSADANVVVEHGSGQPVVFVQQVGAGTVIML
ncbi:MAG TPA: WD40 repeat domain-containing protein, partial [Candidatus Acetothermia bacterium]|nr:WD40 repeat domain-containing protein [Candidatus Acetothermia bacterium]